MNPVCRGEVVDSVVTAGRLALPARYHFYCLRQAADLTVFRAGSRIASGDEEKGQLCSAGPGTLYPVNIVPIMARPSNAVI